MIWYVANTLHYTTSTKYIIGGDRGLPRTTSNTPHGIWSWGVILSRTRSSDNCHCFWWLSEQYLFSFLHDILEIITLRAWYCEMHINGMKTSLPSFLLLVQFIVIQRYPFGLALLNNSIIFSAHAVVVPEIIKVINLHSVAFNTNHNNIHIL